MAVNEPATFGGELDLEDFFENGTVGLHLVGADGTILKANRADYEPLGYSADEYIGQSISRFHADDEAISDNTHRKIGALLFRHCLWPRRSAGRAARRAGAAEAVHNAIARNGFTWAHGIASPSER